MKAKNKFNVGDKIKTNFNGRITHHTVVEVEAEGKQGHCESGVLYRITPRLNNYSRRNEWIDQNWFVAEDEHLEPQRW